MPLPLSVIIPLAPGETSWCELIPDLDELGTRAEVLFVVPDSEISSFEQAFANMSLSPSFRVISSAAGRARQLNAGAMAASGDFLLFLHADSRVPAPAWDRLFASLDESPDRLHYFNLRFQSDGPRRMQLNAWGVWIRSHWFKMPFGDQGFCLKAEHFLKLGGFDETVPCGEDHVFVWTARLQGMRLRCTRATIETSARKYREQGWLKTTIRHLILTIRQAAPFWWRLIWKRCAS